MSTFSWQMLGTEPGAFYMPGTSSTIKLCSLGLKELTGPSEYCLTATGRDSPGVHLSFSHHLPSEDLKLDLRGIEGGIFVHAKQALRPWDPALSLSLSHSPQPPRARLIIYFSKWRVEQGIINKREMSSLKMHLKIKRSYINNFQELLGIIWV